MARRLLWTIHVRTGREVGNRLRESQHRPVDELGVLERPITFRDRVQRHLDNIIIAQGHERRRTIKVRADRRHPLLFVSWDRKVRVRRHPQRRDIVTDDHVRRESRRNPTLEPQLGRDGVDGPQRTDAGKLWPRTERGTRRHDRLCSFYGGRKDDRIGLHHLLLGLVLAPHQYLELDRPVILGVDPGHERRALNLPPVLYNARHQRLKNTLRNRPLAPPNVKARRRAQRVKVEQLQHHRRTELMRRRKQTDRQGRRDKPVEGPGTHARSLKQLAAGHTIVHLIRLLVPVVDQPVL
mmetsp:Transcript_12571/g.35836  ORF Transcript_12571/g.35836 Transcript_12571/m.35836 type:complete len:295 (+) Transcript_12571:3755-4639(+)